MLIAPVLVVMASRKTASISTRGHAGVIAGLEFLYFKSTLFSAWVLKLLWHSQEDLTRIFILIYDNLKICQVDKHFFSDGTC
jgi:hypothetical protein